MAIAGSMAGFLIAGLVAFALGFGLTRRWRRSRLNRSTAPSPPPSAIAPAQPATSLFDADLDRQVRDRIGQGDLIGAIKRVRETTGWSLSQAKAYVEQRLP